jgi:uncharacterized membrane protein
MIQLHTSHGWLLPGARSGGYWDAAQFFGGLAAPLFLFLAGAGLGLQWAHTPVASGSDTKRSIARGIELIVLGYGLRLQMWIIDGAAYRRFTTYPGVLLLIAGYTLAFLCARRWARGRGWGVLSTIYDRWSVGLKRSATGTTPGQPVVPVESAARRSSSLGAFAIGALLCVSAGLSWAFQVDRLRAEGLIRVDVLQCIGASLCLLSAIGARGAWRRPMSFVAIAVAIALATPLMQSWVPGPLPVAVAGYIAQWPNADGQRVLSLFPLFPWLGFASFGVAVGLAWGRASDALALELELLLMRLVVLGVAVALITNASWPPMRWFAPPEPIAALAQLLYKTALCCVMIGPAIALSHAARGIRAPLVLLGRASLLIYWVHLQFAFGTVSRPISRGLSLTGWALGTLALIACMGALAAVRSLRHPALFRRSWGAREPAKEPDFTHNLAK